MNKVVDTLKVCSDCFDYMELPENDSIYYHYGEEEVVEFLDKMEKAQQALKSRYTDCLIAHDGEEKDEDFSHASCDCCASSLAGKRHSYSVIEMAT